MSDTGHKDEHRRGAALRRMQVAAGLLLIVLAAVLVYVAYGDDIRYALSQRELSATVPAVVVTPAPSDPSTSGLDFSRWQEEDLAYWHELREGRAFGRLVAASAKIDEMVVKGAEPEDLKRAPGWIVQTDPPGFEGNCGISGHRVTYGHPFRKLDDLKIGATVDLYSPYRRYRYVVDRILRVTPDHVEVVAHTAEPRLTLTTCDPPGQAVKRLVVQARLVAVDRVTTPFGK